MLIPVKVTYPRAGGTPEAVMADVPEEIILDAFFDVSELTMGGKLPATGADKSA